LLAAATRPEPGGGNVTCGTLSAEGFNHFVVLYPFLAEVATAAFNVLAAGRGGRTETNTRTRRARIRRGGMP
jgi:hypothetical protein